MNVFDLVATISLDSSQYDAQLGKAKAAGDSIGGGIGGAFGKAAKIAGAAIAGATTAVIGFSAESVKTGMSFDSSMSQVAATMGKTTGEIGNLREFAQEMGRTTAFSATEAADALNYMALAGYDADTSMKMLPNVLNLAAAGSMDLATASDMVTDAQSALGLSLDETGAMVDQMAKASSKSNTSVEQLGSAFLQIGATARGVKGGTVELSTVLGALADNGIKGAEGGTHLRNMLLSLQTPTKAGTEALEKLGMSYADMYDEAGNMRALPEIFLDLQGAMEGMTQQSKDAIISGIFNKTDLAAANALVGTTAERFDELTNAISDSKGAAEEMAKTQLDNLEGDVKLFQSALEGAQIAISDKLTPSLRDFVQFGSEGLSKITEGFQSGGLDGAMTALGNVITQGLNLIVSKLPEAISAGAKLLGAIGEGLVSNLPAIASAGMQIITTLAQNIASAIPQMMAQAPAAISGFMEGITSALPTLAESAIEIITSLTEGIKENFPQMIEAGLQGLMEFSGSLRENVGEMVDAGLALIIALADGLIQALPTMIETIPTIVSNIAGIINDNAPKLIATGIQLILMLVTGIIQAVPTLIAEFPKIIQAIWDVFTAINWINLGSSIITAIGNGVKSLASNIPDIVKNIGQKAFDFFKNIRWQTLGTDLIRFIVNGIRGLMSQVPTILKNVGTKAFNAFKNIKWLSLGKSIIDGIIKGVKEAGSKLFDALKNLAKKALDSAKKVLKIKSPSQVFRDDVGKNIALGIAEGINDGTTAVEDALSDTSSVLANSFDMPDIGVNHEASEGSEGSTGNNVVINVYGAVGQDVRELAEIIEQKITESTLRRTRAFV